MYKFVAQKLLVTRNLKGQCHVKLWIAVARQKDIGLLNV